MTYNMMTCEGGNWVRSAILGDCSLSWFTVAIVVFLAMILRRQTEDGILAGTSFNFFGALGLGLIADIATVSIIGSPRWALLAGLVGVAVGGFLLGMIFDTSGGGESG